MLTRSVNTGFSGGEKKRNEILQMAVLEPKLGILDETDSGLDIDALRIVADGVNKLKRPDNATIVVTHYQRLLNYIVPDFVHVLANGRIAQVGRQGTGARARGEGLRLGDQASSARQGQRRERARHDGSRSNRTSTAFDALTPAATGVRRGVQSHCGAPRSSASPRSASRRRRTRTGTSRASRRSPSRNSRCSRRASGDVQPRRPRAVRRSARRDWHTMVFVNGRFAPELSDLDDAARRREAARSRDRRGTTRPTSPSASGTIASYESHAFTALNTAFMHDGAVVRDRAATSKSTRPIHLLFVTDATAAQGR